MMQPPPAVALRQHEEDVCLATFDLGDLEFAIAIEKVREAVILHQTVTRIPGSIEVVEGIIDLRGEIIPIVNLKARFGITPPAYSPDCRVAIVTCKGRHFGMRFDRTREVIRIKRSAIKEVRSEGTESATQGVIVLPGARERIIQVIDPDCVFEKYDLPQISGGFDDATRAAAARAVERLQCITVALDEQEYAFEVSSIREIIKVPEIKKRIDLGGHIRGVILLRGECITLVDLRVHLGLEERPPDLDSRVLVMAGATSYGLLVDAVREVVRFDKRLLLAMPPLANRRSRQVYKAVVSLVGHHGPRNLLLLDLQELFSADELTQLRQNVGLHSEAADDKRGPASTVPTDPTDTGRVEKKKAYLAFKLQEDLALDLLAVREILCHSTEIIPVPGQADFLEGVLNLRGDVIPVVNLRTFFELGARERVGAEKILVVDDGTRRAGLVVDEIQEIVQLGAGTARLQGIVIAGLEKRRMFKGVVQEVLSVPKHGRDAALMVFNVKKLLDAIFPQVAAGSELVEPTRAPFPLGT